MNNYGTGYGMNQPAFGKSPGFGFPGVGQPYYSPLSRGYVNPFGGGMPGVGQMGPQRPTLPPRQTTNQIGGGPGPFRGNLPPATTPRTGMVVNPNGQRPQQPLGQAAIPQMIQGAMPTGPGRAGLQGDVNGAGRLARPLMDNPAAFGGFMSQPPEPSGRPYMNNVFGVDTPAPGSQLSEETRRRIYEPQQLPNMTPQQMQERGNMGAPQRPTAPPARSVGASSFGNAPNWDQEQATLERMNQQQTRFREMDALRERFPNFRDNLAGSMERDRGIVEKGVVPDVNDPSFQPITPQQAFTQIPGNNYAQMRDRFNAMKANPFRTPTEPPMTAQQPTSTMPNYAQRYAAAEAENIAKNPEYVPVDANGPAYRLENGQVVPRGNITPMPRADGQLTPEEFRRMQAVGSSVGEWEKKSQWLKQKYPNHTGEMTPEQAQAYTAEQQQKRLAQNDMIHQNKMKRIGQAEQIRDAKSKQAGQLFQRNNPQLFTTPDFTAAQLQYGLAGGDMRQFQNPGLTPQQAMAAQLRNDQNQVQLIQQEPDPEKRARMIEAYQRSKQFGGGGVGGIPTAPPTGYGMPPMNSGDPASSDRYNRDDDGELSRGRVAGKISSVVSNPNATPQDLLGQGINQYTLAELESNLERGWISDPAETVAMRELIARARKILGVQGQGAGGQSAGGQAAGQGMVPMLPPAVPPSPGPGGQWGNPYGPSF